MRPSESLFMESAKPNWERRLLDDDEELRYDAAREIARAGRQVLPDVESWARDDRPRLREMACYIAGQIGEIDPDNPVWLRRYDDGIPLLVESLASDPDENVRASAAFALGHHAAKSTIPALLDAIDDPSADVRYGVACALGSFLEPHWDAGNSVFRDDVRKALLKLMDDEDDDVRDWATFGIHQGGHDTAETRKRLWKALEDSHPDVRGEAAAGLALFGDRMVIPRLERLLREDEEISPCYFEAAVVLNDPYLLPAVEDAADRWRQTMAEGEELHWSIASALQSLQNAAEETE